MSTPDRVHAYTQAFYSAAMERWLDALGSVSDHLSRDPALANRLQGDADFASRQRLLDGLMPADVDLPVRNFLYTLAQHGDLGLLPRVVNGLREMMARVGEGPVEVQVTTAVPLIDEERDILVAKLQRQFGNNLDLHYVTDPAILGGMIVQAGDKLIDGSVASRFAEMRQALGVTVRE
jgi:F-type H+-transporting ATPase subunit delta